MSISWGKSERYSFTAGGALNTWLPPSLAAVYSITFKQDPNKKPKAHTVFYFGEAADLSQESISINKVLNSFAESNIDADDLFIFVHPMPGSTRIERSKVQQTLVKDYLPRGNGF